MALLRAGRVVADDWVDACALASLPAAGPLIVSLEQWQDHWQSLLRRPDGLGIRLRSDQHPEIIADDLDQLRLVALEFPVFRDGRPYSHARLLRERYGFRGELRAVGDVLVDQLHFMQRVGFDAFELPAAGAEAEAAWQAAAGEFSVWYQPAADQREPASRRRRPVS